MKEKHTYRYLAASGELPEAMRVNPYTVPVGYFDDLQQRILQRSHHIDDAQASFTVPSGYFDQLHDDIVAKIAEQQLKEKVSEPGFSVPEGYFENLERRVLERSVRINDNVATTMDVPPGYFQQLQEDILAKVAEQTLKEHVGDAGFTVPNDYFATLERHITDRTSDERVTPIRRISQPRWMTYAAAACIALAVSIVGFFRLNNSDQVVSTTHLATVSDQEILNYLELYGAENDIIYISEHLDDFGERTIGEGLDEEDIEAYLNNTL